MSFLAFFCVHDAAAARRQYLALMILCCFKTGHWRKSLVVWSHRHAHWLQLAPCMSMLVQMR